MASGSNSILPQDGLQDDGAVGIFTIKEDTVQRVFEKINIRKSPGPDNIGGKVLRYCSAQLSGVFCYLFQHSLDTQVVPRIWKKLHVAPLPKVPHPSSPKDYRPISLTSLVVKSFERIVKTHIINACQQALDPLQFAYRHDRGTDDAAVTLLDYLYMHLEGSKTHARVLFADFSSAFNTIHPHILAERLKKDFCFDFKLIKWTMDFLQGRVQQVKVGNILSDVRLTSIGTPQGSVLSPLLFILYTNSCCSSHPGCHIIKYADDTALVSLLNHNEATHGPALEEFVNWSKMSNLHLNISKTKELIFDFRQKVLPVPPSVIRGEEIEVVMDYKYLGLIIDHKLSWDRCADAIYLGDPKGSTAFVFPKET